MGASCGSCAASELPLLTARASVPEHVVYRQFPQETVLLNLTTGTYHGLNQSGGRMLEALERAPSIGDAVERMAAQFAQPPALIERDLRELCAALSARGLLVIGEDAEP